MLIYECFIFGLLVEVLSKVSSGLEGFWHILIGYIHDKLLILWLC